MQISFLLQQWLQGTRLDITFITTLVFSLIFRRNGRDVMKSCICFDVNICYSCSILMRIEFSWQIFKNSQISNFIQILTFCAELLHSDGQT